MILNKLLNKESSSTTIPHGSEFYRLSQLATIYMTHPMVPFLANLMRCGMKYHVTEELSENERMAELNLNMKQGNHKSTASEPQIH